MQTRALVRYAERRPAVSLRRMVGHARTDYHTPIFFKTLAVCAVAPFSLYMAAAGAALPMWQRGALAAMGGGFLVVDGIPLLRYYRDRKRRRLTVSR